MSSLWTPEGEHKVPRPGGGAPPAPTPDSATTAPDGAAPDTGLDPRGAEELAALEQEVLRAPAEDVVANHCYGFFELAALHLGSDPPHLHDAQLAIDALGAVLDGLPGRLGDPEAQLREALTQIRLAFVRIEGAGRSAGGAPASGSEPGTS